MLVLQNDIQRFEFIGGIRTKILFTHSSIEIPNKFWKKQEEEGVYISLCRNILLCGNPLYK